MTSNLILHFMDLVISLMLLVVAIVRNSISPNDKIRVFVTFVAILNFAMAVWVTIMYLFYLYTGGIWI